MVLPPTTALPPFCDFFQVCCCSPDGESPTNPAQVPELPIAAPTAAGGQATVPDGRAGRPVALGLEHRPPRGSSPAGVEARPTARPKLALYKIMGGSDQRLS